MPNILITKLRNGLSRGLKSISEHLLTDEYYRVRDLLFPYAHSEDEKYCFVATCEDDVFALNALSKIKNMKGFCVACDRPGKLGSVYQIISFDDITKMGFSTVVIPTPSNEKEAEKRLRKIHQETGHEFSIWDSYAYFLAGRIYSGLKEKKQGFVRKPYRDVTLSLSEGNIVLPHLYGNWGYINHLVRNELRDGLNVLDMWTGSGCIGLSLKKERPTINVDLADINYFAILAIEESIKLDPGLNGCHAYLSNAFDQIPRENEYDLIVGNPPCGRGFASDFIQVGGSDDEWKSHLSFFNNAHQFLRPGGRICLVEQVSERDAHTVEFAEEFYRAFKKSYPQYGEITIKPLKGTFLSIVTITKGS
jgi:hypothetical protein